ncbi:hypothetical protein POTOM_018097 [Populus tomentosa]|uniref:Cellulose synthase-like protein D3 n=1 Tax=Populus tomentosa TaxID=118781 RepID=A0A8X7ZW31_POPTO|nr:hypothetical protein POTOM_018097 [Populus tomentosa]
MRSPAGNTANNNSSQQGNRSSTGQTVKFARRTSSGRYVSLSREDLDISGELSGDYTNYTVQIPSTPDNQPMDTSVAVKAEEQYVSNSLFTGGFNSVTRAHLMDKVIDSEVSHPQMAGAKGSSCAIHACDGKVMKDERGQDVIPCECRFKICRDCYMDAQKDTGLCPGCKEPYKVGDYEDEIPNFSSGALPLPPPSKGGDHNNMTMTKRNQNGDFDHNRWLFETQGTYGYGNAFWPQDDMYGDDGDEGFPGGMLENMDKPWKPLSLNLEEIDTSWLLIVVRLVVLGFFLHWRIMHPNDDARWLWGMSVVCEVWFAFSWILDIIPKLSPINRFTDLEVLRDKIDFVKDRRKMKREYDEFKVRINGLPDSIRRRSDAFNAREEMKMLKHMRESAGGDPLEVIKVPKATWMADGTHWPGTWAFPAAEHSKGDHAGILQVMLKPPSPDPLMGGADDKMIDFTDGPVYVGTGCMFRRFALYGFDPPNTSKTEQKTEAETLPLRATDFDPDLDYNLLPKRFGNSTMLAESIPVAEFQGRPLADHPAVKYGRPPGALRVSREPLDAATVAEAVSVISCWYEDKTEWGDRVGWIYGSVTEDVVTGYRMHNRGWRSVYCITKRDAFRGSAPINLTDRLHQVLRWATGSVEIFFSRNNAFLATRRLKMLQRLAYLNVGIYPFTSIFLIVYCFLPALSLFSGFFIVQTLDITFLIYLLLITICLVLLAILEVKWSGIELEEWWRNEQFWLISGTSAHFAAVMQGLLKVIAGIEISFTLTSKSAGDDVDDIYADLYLVKWTSLMIPPIVIAMTNIIAMAFAFIRTIYSTVPQWSKFVGGAFFSFWVLAHLYPFAKGLMGRRRKTPTIVFVWSGLIAITISLLWIAISPPKATGTADGAGGGFQFP